MSQTPPPVQPKPPFCPFVSTMIMINRGPEGLKPIPLLFGCKTNCKLYSATIGDCILKSPEYVIEDTDAGSLPPLPPADLGRAAGTDPTSGDPTGD
jgi:hypothetical protein